MKRRCVVEADTSRDSAFSASNKCIAFFPIVNRIHFVNGFLLDFPDLKYICRQLRTAIIPVFLDFFSSFWFFIKCIGCNVFAWLGDFAFYWGYLRHLGLTTFGYKFECQNRLFQSLASSIYLPVSPTLCVCVSSFRFIDWPLDIGANLSMCLNLTKQKFSLKLRWQFGNEISNQAMWITDKNLACAECVFVCVCTIFGVIVRLCIESELEIINNLHSVTIETELMVYFRWFNCMLNLFLEYLFTKWI